MRQGLQDGRPVRDRCRICVVCNDMHRVLKSSHLSVFLVQDLEKYKGFDKLAGSRKSAGLLEWQLRDLLVYLRHAFLPRSFCLIRVAMMQKGIPSSGHAAQPLNSFAGPAMKGS